MKKIRRLCYMSSVSLGQKEKKKKEKGLFYPPSPPPAPICAVKVGKVVSASQRFNGKKGGIERGKKEESEENVSGVEGSCATPGISDVGKMARRKREYAERKTEQIEREKC